MEHLRHMGEVAFHRRGAHGRPDQPFGDARIGGVERVQIGVRLPLLEQQLLPAKSIDLRPPWRYIKTRKRYSRFERFQLAISRAENQCPQVFE